MEHPQDGSRWARLARRNLGHLLEAIQSKHRQGAPLIMPLSLPGQPLSPSPSVPLQELLPVLLHRVEAQECPAVRP